MEKTKPVPKFDLPVAREADECLRGLFSRIATHNFRPAHLETLQEGIIEKMSQEVAEAVIKYLSK